MGPRPQRKRSLHGTKTKKYRFFGPNDAADSVHFTGIYQRAGRMCRLRQEIVGSGPLHRNRNIISFSARHFLGRETAAVEERAAAAAAAAAATAQLQRRRRG
jgi:hypothetical protein